MPTLLLSSYRDAVPRFTYMLNNIRILIEALNATGIRYCHWKSNAALPEALCGLTDVDLLICRQDANAFREILTQCCFRPAANRYGGSFPSTEHYFAMDSETGTLAHVHAYYSVITGESLAKNFRLPVEGMLLENTRQILSVRVPTKAAEFVVFTMRMMLKHTTLVELALLAREWDGLKREMDSLADDGSLDASLRLLEKWLPNVSTKLFAQCVSALKTPAPLITRLVLAHRLRSSLRFYARHSRLQASWTGVRSFCLMLMRRVTHAPKGLVLRSGGALVAFVGPEATGKSTLIREVSQWLGEHFQVECMHAGKPSSTMLTLVPNTLVPLLRRAMPGQRPSELESQHANRELDRPETWVYPLSFAVRSVLLAYDRRALLARAFSKAANGTIVLCDRYPYVARGSPDGPRLMHYPLPQQQYPVRRMLSDLEQKFYAQIPGPDLIVSLTTPVEIAIARNRTRGKHEPEDYVRRRHAAGSLAPDEEGHVCCIDTNRELNSTLQDVKRQVWDTL